MCGIAGIAGNSDPRHAEKSVDFMLAALARRGPDGTGRESWPHAVLGHRRLAVFDLSPAGAQPMLSPDRRIGVTFNGAIYNFKELRAELENRRFVFLSNTDTEVLVHGFRAWGIDGLVGRLHGMFAFALWDDENQTLYLVRDRLGIKPLLYTEHGSGIAFASTASALRAGGCAGEPDDAAIAEYLEYGFITDARSIYEGVRKLPAASIGRWKNGELSLREYWQPSRENDHVSTSFEEALAQTEQMLLSAVKMRLAADVPVGALLSGGIDSSLVCWAIARLGADVTAFTVGTPGDPWDETADARATARELGLRHTVLEANAENSPSVDELISAYGEPFACASALGMLRVSKAAKKQATVLLTGDGGDDVFLGYPRHAHFALAQRLAGSIPTRAARAWNRFSPKVPEAGPLRRAAHLLDYAAGGLGAVTQVHDGLPTYRTLRFLGERMQNVTVPSRQLEILPERGKSVLTDFLEYERRTRFVSEYLTKVDGGSMYYALEARSPFLDQELWHFASALPYNVRLRGGTLKALLRELARRNISERVARGAKRGFGIPVQRWITGRWRKDVEEAMGDSLLSRLGFIRSESVLNHLRSLGAGETAPNQIWYLYVLEKWMRAHWTPIAESKAEAV